MRSKSPLEMGACTTVNSGMTPLYSHRQTNGHRSLGRERAAYSQQMFISLARQLIQEFGASFGEKQCAE